MQRYRLTARIEMRAPSRGPEIDRARAPKWCHMEALPDPPDRPRRRQASEGRMKSAIAALSIALLALQWIGLRSAARADAPAGGRSGAQAARILQLEDQREAAPLAAILKAEDPSVRARAAIAAGRIGDATLVIPLSLLLSNDPDASVRANAAFGLGEIEDSTAAESLAAIFRRKADRDPTVRERIVEGIGKLHIDRLAPLCTVALHDSTDQVREAACLAVWQLHAVEAWSPLVTIATDASSSGDLRWKSAYALMRMVGAPASGKTPIPGGTDIPTEARAKIRDVLTFLARDRDPQVRMAAVRGLAAFDDSATTICSRAALGDADWRVRVEAMRTRTLSAGNIRPLLDDPNPNVRLGALDALGRTGRPKEAVRILRVHLPRNLREREVAAIALASRMKDDRAAVDSIAIALASSREWQLRASATTALLSAGAPDSAGIALLVRLAGDEPRVAQTAVGPLLRCRAERAKPGERLAATRVDLARFLENKDPVLRSIALESEAAVLGDSLLDPQRADWLSIVRQAWSAARADSASNDVASTVVSILESHKKNAAAIAILREAALSRDYSVRSEACRILGVEHPEPFETGRSPSEYGSILGWAEAEHEVAIRTRGGTIRIRLFSRDAPLTCWNFFRLADKGYFDQGSWHRVVPDFVVQDGCPRGDGFGGPGYTIRCEMNEHGYRTGTVGMALSGKDTGGSQFFITHSPQPHLDGRYTVFGEVLEGMDLIDNLVQYDTIETIRPVGR